MKKIKFFLIYILIIFSLIMDISKLPEIFNQNYFYIIKPLYWTFLFIFILIFFKNETIVNYKYKKNIIFTLIISFLIYFLINFWIGIINGFGYNPYDRTIKGIIFNLWTFMPLLITREYIRFYIINNCKQKNILWITLLTSIIFVLVESNMYKFNIYFENSLSSLKYFMEIFTPSLILQLFLTYICYFSGYIIPIFYILIPKLLMFTLPILPKIDASLLAVINSIIPFLTYLLINYDINKIDKTIDRKKYKVVDIKSIIVMLVFVILMICFGIGVFPYEPLVIASNSMAPQIKKGDIVIIKDSKFEDVKKGDIIRYRLDDYYVVHRVKDFFYDDEKQFVTKGDNNKDIDLYPVNEKQFDGIIKYKLSYLGWPTIILNDLFNKDKNVTIDKGVEINEK